MGLLDKVSAGLKNVDNKIGQEIDESKYNSKIRDLEREIADMKSKLGEDVYEAYAKGETFDLESSWGEIKSKHDELEATKAEKEEMIAAAEAEREKNRQEAEKS